MKRLKEYPGKTVSASRDMGDMLPLPAANAQKAKLGDEIAREIIGQLDPVCRTCAHCKPDIEDHHVIATMSIRLVGKVKCSGGFCPDAGDSAIDSLLSGVMALSPANHKALHAASYASGGLLSGTSTVAGHTGTIDLNAMVKAAEEIKAAYGMEDKLIVTGPGGQTYAVDRKALQFNHLDFNALYETKDYPIKPKSPDEPDSDLAGSW